MFTVKIKMKKVVAELQVHHKTDVELPGFVAMKRILFLLKDLLFFQRTDLLQEVIGYIEEVIGKGQREYLPSSAPHTFQEEEARLTCFKEGSGSKCEPNKRSSEFCEGCGG